MIYPKMLSILSQAYTLPPLRDDLALLPYQVQKFSDPAHLAKRQYSIATLYWDRNGNIKAVFNVQISFVVAQILRNEGLNLAQSVLTAFRTFVIWAAGSGAGVFGGALWQTQLGNNWPAIIPSVGGQATLGVLVTLRPPLRSFQNTVFVLQLMQFWFHLGGYGSFQQEVADAAIAGTMGGIRTERPSLTERQIVEARSDSEFCKLTIQNWQFVLAPGKLDTLLAPLITC